MIKSAYDILKTGETNYPDRKCVEANGVQSALNIAFRTATDLADGEILTIYRRLKDDRIQPLLQLSHTSPKAKHQPGSNGWITFERVGERVKIVNFDFCGLDALKKSCALMSGARFDAIDAATTERTQRNVAR